MPEQIPFDYHTEPSSGVIEGSANHEVIAALRRRIWPTGRVAVIGSPFSGKSILARQLLMAGGASVGTAEGTSKLMSGSSAPLLVIDNFTRFIAGEGAEEAFFHLLNRTAETGQKVAIFSRHALDDIDIALPDLRSRLGTFEVLRIGLPDDAMVSQIIAKAFDERGVRVSPDVIDYLSKRVERSYEAIHKAVEALDVSALQDKGKVHKARVRQYLEGLEPE